MRTKRRLGSTPASFFANTATTTNTAMDTTEHDNTNEAQAQEPTTTTSYLTNVAAREVESWLISLAVRLLWQQGQHSDAFELAQKGIEILHEHLEQQPQSSSLFPLLARLFRWRCLAAESMESPAVEAGLRVGLARAHNVATLRRDVDTQATLLNQMLRDLLRHSQSTYSICVCDCVV